MTSPEPLSGILVVDKPAGWTSHDVVNKTRRMLGGGKVGHTGTLDPIATGVLVLLLGKATKQACRYTDDSKRYLAEVTFGIATNTYDCTGEITAEGDPRMISPEVLERSIQSFVGESKQTPPMFSAVKVGGRKLYDLARSGKTVERAARTIFIDSIESDVTSFPVVRLDIVCSKGTYIRAIAHELGIITGCPAHLSSLRRIFSGAFHIDKAIDFIALTRSSSAASAIRDSIIPLSESAT